MKQFIIIFLVMIAFAVPAFGQTAEEVDDLLIGTTTTVPTTTTTTTTTTQPAAQAPPPAADPRPASAAEVEKVLEPTPDQPAPAAADPAVDEAGQAVVGDENLIPLTDTLPRDRHGATFAVTTPYAPGKVERNKIRADVLDEAAAAYFGIPVAQRPRIRVYAFADTIRYRGHHTEFNPALSIARLSPIVQYLNEQKGVPLDHIVYGFYSETERGHRYTAVKVFRDSPGAGGEMIVAGKPACDDGIDNDGDGKIDFPADPGCESATDTSEIDAAKPACDDGIDNDGDGLIDFPEDPGCVNKQDSSEDDKATVVSASTWSLFVQAESAWGFYPKPFMEKTFTGYDKQSAGGNDWNHYQSFNALAGIEFRRGALLVRGALGIGLSHVLSTDPAFTTKQSKHNMWGFRALGELGWDVGETNGLVFLAGGSFASLRPDDEMDSAEGAFTAPHLTVAYRAPLSETVFLAPYVRGGYLIHWWQLIPDHSDVKWGSGVAGSAGVELLF